MNRTDLATAIAKHTELDRGTVGTVLDALDDQLQTIVRDGDELRWPGLFTLDVADRPGRTGRNPRTGEELQIPAGRSVRIRPGSRLKAATQ